MNVGSLVSSQNPPNISGNQVMMRTVGPSQQDPLRSTFHKD